MDILKGAIDLVSSNIGAMALAGSILVFGYSAVDKLVAPLIKLFIGSKNQRDLVDTVLRLDHEYIDANRDKFPNSMNSITDVIVDTLERIQVGIMENNNGKTSK
jgi:Co/Zn/Cd efflux system component